MKTLLDFSPRTALRIVDLPADLAPDLRSHLTAWGLMPGARLTLLGHAPVTRLAVEHAELALEHSVARLVRVTVDTSAANT